MQGILVLVVTLAVISTSYGDRFIRYEKQDNFTQSAASFTSELYKKVAARSSARENFVISPFAVHTGLTMAYFGASGETAAQMRETLNLVLRDNDIAHQYEGIYRKKSGSVKYANKIYVPEGMQVDDDYNSRLWISFNTSAENVNFGNPSGAVSTINSWIQQNTNGKIRDMLSPSSVGPETKAVIVNALRFKGVWERGLEKSNTKKEPFWISETETKEVDMMSSRHYAKFKFGDGYTAMEKPFLRDRGGYSMIFLLPHEKDGLEELERKLTSETIAQIRKRMALMEMEMKIPKFEIEFGMELGDTLKQMGMTSMFESSADFSKLTDTPVHVSSVVHKAIVKVDEDGTYDTGASTMDRQYTVFPRSYVFIADHPFIYLVVNRHGLIYLMGRVVDP